MAQPYLSRTLFENLEQYETPAVPYFCILNRLNPHLYLIFNRVKPQEFLISPFSMERTTAVPNFAFSTIEDTNYTLAVPYFGMLYNK